MSGRSNTKGVYFRDGIAYIRYQDERGGDVRESTKQRSAKAAVDILAKRKTEVAMRVHFPTRAFDAVTFAELAAYWWQAHGSKTRSQFEYLYPKVLEYFIDKRARDITPDVVDAFLDYLAAERKLSASSVNHHRTIVNGIFNFAVKRGRFDRNPVAAVRQRPEPPGRDRIVSPAEFRTLWDKAEGDREMRAFLALAGTTTMPSWPSEQNRLLRRARRTRRWKLDATCRLTPPAGLLSSNPPFTFENRGTAAPSPIPRSRGRASDSLRRGGHPAAEIAHRSARRHCIRPKDEASVRKSTPVSFPNARVYERWLSPAHRPG
jgi:hypothetical protein